MKNPAGIIRFLSFILVTTAYSINGQGIEISGRIMDTLGRGLAGASVQLLILPNLSTISGQDGSYCLATSGAAPRSIIQKNSPPVFSNGRISFSLERKTKVALSVFDIQGKVIAASSNTLPVGSYDMTISGIDGSAGFHLIKLVIGEQQYNFKQNSISRKNSFSKSIVHADNVKVELSKKTATIDTLQVTLSGYATSKTPITSLMGSYDVILKAVVVAPTITAQPQSIIVSAGRTATFTVTAVGTNPQYQWQKDSVNIPGATNASYTTPATVLSDNGKTFRCIVSNLGGTITSIAAMLTVVVTKSVFDFKITNEFSGWTQSTGEYATFNNPTTLQAIIDGGYSIYTDQGMIEGFMQRMDGGTAALPKAFEVYAMDFGTSAKAQAIFGVKKAQATSPDSFPGYSATTAIYSLFLGGIKVIAHFSTFYFEVSVAGYDDTPTALEDAKMFVDFYRQKAQ